MIKMATVFHSCVSFLRVLVLLVRRRSPAYLNTQDFAISRSSPLCVFLAIGLDIANLSMILSHVTEYSRKGHFGPDWPLRIRVRKLTGYG